MKRTWCADFVRFNEESHSLPKKEVQNNPPEYCMLCHPSTFDPLTKQTKALVNRKRPKIYELSAVFLRSDVQIFQNVTDYIVYFTFSVLFP